MRTAAWAALLLLLSPTAAGAAGDVRITAKGDGLVLSGDGAANDVVIDQSGLGPDEFRIASGPDATTLDGQAGPLVFSGVSGDIRIDAGPGQDTFRLETCSLPGDLVAASKQGSLDLQLFQCNVLGNVSVKTGDGLDALEIDGCDIGGALRVSAGKGGSQVSIANATIGGDLKLAAKDGSDTVMLSNAVVNGRASIADGSGDSNVSADGSTLHGDLKVTSKKDGVSSRVFQLSASTLHGAVQVKSGGAGVTASIDATSIAESLFVLGGGAPTQAWITGGSTLGGVAEVRTKKAPSHVTVSDSDLQGGLQQRIQSSFGSMTLQNSNFGDEVMADLGSGGSLVASSSLIQGQFKVDANSTSLFLDLDDLTVLMPTYIESGGGDDTFQIDDSSFGMLLLDVRDGVDSLEIERGGDPDSGPGTRFSGVVSIETGRQDDSVRIGEAGAAGRFVDFGDAVSIDGETGDDLIDHLDNGNLFAEPPQMLNFETIL